MIAVCSLGSNLYMREGWDTLLGQFILMDDFNARAFQAIAFVRTLGEPEVDTPMREQPLENIRFVPVHACIVPPDQFPRRIEIFLGTIAAQLTLSLIVDKMFWNGPEVTTFLGVQNEDPNAPTLRNADQLLNCILLLRRTHATHSTVITITTVIVTACSHLRLFIL